MGSYNNFVLSLSCSLVRLLKRMNVLRVLKCWNVLFPAVSYSTTSASAATRVFDENRIRTITLCNPKSRNALSLSTINEILDHMSIDKNQHEIRCIVFRAEGPVFSSGHNLKEFDIRKSGTEHSRQVFSTFSLLMKQVVESSVPVVAVVEGLAAAAGCQLVAQCDIALCTPSSTFSTPGANFGLFCSTPGIAVARSVSRKIALRMLLTGLPITADEAYLCGLISKVTPAESIDNELRSICDAIKSKSQSVISLGKKFFYEQVEKDLFTAYRLGEDVMVNNLALKDGQEGIISFIEKRKPCWSNISEEQNN